MAQEPMTGNPYTYSYTVDGPGSPRHTVLFTTAGTFVDRNIGINISVPSATLGATLTIPDITTNLAMGDASDGNYEPTVAISGTINNAQAGWLESGDKTVIKNGWKIGKVPQSALSKKTGTNGTYGAIVGNSIDPDVTNQYLKVSAGYYPTDREITIVSSTQGTAGEYNASVDDTATVNGTVTPSIEVSSTATTTYGFTTTQPAGTANTNYLTLDPGGTVTTNWSVTPVATITTAGYISTGSQSGTATTGAPTIATGTNYYVPIRTISFSGGELTPTGYSKNDLALTLAADTSSGATNMTNIAATSEKDTTNYPYYFKIDGSTPAVSGTTTVALTAVKYSNNAGVVAAHNNTQAIAATSSSPTVNVNATSGSIYVGLKQASITIGGTNTVTASLNLTKANTITWGDTNNGISVSATGGGSATITATATTSIAGYAPTSTQLGSATKTGSDSTSQTKYITAINVPANTSFTISTADNSSTDNSKLTVNNGNNRIVEVENKGGVNSAVYVKHPASGKGDTYIRAYNETSDTIIVENGVWKTPTVNASGTYYGKVIVGNGSVTQNAPTINSSTGLVTATSSVTAGYVTTATPTNTLQLTTLGATTYNTSTSNQIIPAGNYLIGEQTIRAVTTTNITAANIKTGVTVKVGDSADDDRITSITGTFTAESTVSSGQTAAAEAQIRSGYSAWVNGLEVKGSLANTSITQGTTSVSGTTVTRGTASWNTGYITSGSIPAATFSNSATNDGRTYVDISNTTSAPVLIAGEYLYINKGYTDNLKISLAQLVPNGASAELASNVILSGYSAYNNDGVLVAGNIETYDGSYETTIA